MATAAFPLTADLAPEADTAQYAFELALITDEPLVFFRRRGWLRWEATLWAADRVETTAATYTFVRLRKIAFGYFRWSAKAKLTHED